MGWRQNEQTYDAVSFQREKWGGFDVRAAYVGNTNRIFGDDVPAGDHDMDTWLLNVGYGLAEAGKLVGYYYDIDNKDATGLSNRSIGARFVGKRNSATRWSMRTRRTRAATRWRTTPITTASTCP